MAKQTYRLICAWCKRDMGPTACKEGDSHGICGPCARRETGKVVRVPRAALIAHMRERLALGQLGNDAQLRAALRSPRLLEELADKDVDGGCW